MIIESVGQVIEAHGFVMQLEDINLKLAICTEARDYMRVHNHEQEADYGDQVVQGLQKKREEIINQLQDLFDIKDASTYTYYDKSKLSPKEE